MRRTAGVTAAMSLLAAASGAAAAEPGQATFESFCAACHSVERPAKNLQGPSLLGVVGRKAGTVPGFAYSPAMKAYGAVWTAATLDAYLANPKAKVPGTLMTFRGVSDPAARAGLVAWLERQK